jgi:ABC-type sugar transport system ATPase subunit
MIQLKDVIKDYRSPAGVGFVLGSLNMRIENGLLAILGTNGSGKSTLLKLISGEIAPNSGGITFANPKTHVGDNEGFRAGPLYLDQDAGRDIVPSMTVAQNLYLALMPSRYGVLRMADRRATRAAAAELLAHLPLPLHLKLDDQAGFLSGGERQSLVLARAMALNPNVLLLDEFSSSLTIQLAVQGFLAVQAMVRENQSCCVFVTHQFDLAFRFADYIAFLHNGQLVIGPEPNGFELQRRIEAAYHGYFDEVLGNVDTCVRSN